MLQHGQLQCHKRFLLQKTDLGKPPLEKSLLRKATKCNIIYTRTFRISNQKSSFTSLRMIRFSLGITDSTTALIRSPKRRLSLSRIRLQPMRLSSPRLPRLLTGTLEVRGNLFRGTRAHSSTPISTKAPNVVTLVTQPVTSKPGRRFAMDITEDRNIGAKRSTKRKETAKWPLSEIVSRK